MSEKIDKKKNKKIQRIISGFTFFSVSGEFLCHVCKKLKNIFPDRFFLGLFFFLFSKTKRKKYSGETFSISKKTEKTFPREIKENEIKKMFFSGLFLFFFFLGIVSVMSETE